MLRVLSLGLSLPQSTLTTSQPFRVSTWNLPLPTLQNFQARLVFNFAMRFPEHPKRENDTNDDQEGKDKGENPQRAVYPHAWKKGLFRQELLRKPIRPLRPIRPPPKYPSTPQSPTAPGETNVAVQPIPVFPLQQIQKQAENGSSLSFMYVATSSSPGLQQCSRHPKGRGPDALLRVLAETPSMSEAWEAYDMLLKRSPRPVARVQPGPIIQRAPLVIPYEYLHRLARLLSTTHPRTRRLFLRLLSVLSTLRDTGGTIFLWEWNALIDCAGKGWRKTTMDDYRSALGVFKDMVTSGYRASSSLDPGLEIENVSSDKRPVAQPDIVTFTTLLDIASRSLSENAINHATTLLDASELPWNHVTHMVKLRYFTRTQQLDSVLGILRAAVHRGLDLATLNGCLWAYARNGRLRVALEVYELLRHNIPAEDRTDFDEMDAMPDSSSEEKGKLENPILNTPDFVLPGAMCPDQKTYTLLIQAMCYHGDFIVAMRIFRDMVSTVDPMNRVHHHPVGRRSNTPIYYKPTLPIFRAIFLGFARHGDRRRTFIPTLVSKRRGAHAVSLSEFAARLSPSDPGAGARSSPHHQPEPQTHWTLENLETLFKTFLRGWDDRSTVNPQGDSTTMIRPSDRTIYWIMAAYAKTTAGDVGKMYEVWRELDARFGYGESGVKIWPGRIARFGEQLENRYRTSAVVEDSGPEMDRNE